MASPSGWASRSGAQRLSASQTWSPGPASGAAWPRTVLNASRRHRLGHSRQAVTVTTREPLCSTPLGVTDLVTIWATVGDGRVPESAQRLSASQTWSQAVRHDSGRRRVSAQRLSASQTWSRCDRFHACLVVRCSTPLGVTDLVTRRQPIGWPKRWRVLNASRRHRLGHLATARKNSLMRGAQRLSASQTWSLDRGPCRYMRCRRCSTPLGVTDLVTPRMLPPGIPQCRPVLNASRRHRLGHTPGR